MALPEINIVISATADKLTSVVGGVERRLGTMGDRAEAARARLARFSSATAELGRRLSLVSAGIVAGSAGLFALANNAAQAGAKIDDASKAAGVGAEYFQEMAYAAGLVADMSQEEMGAALGMLTRKIGEAGEGSKGAAAALEQLGFTQEQIAAGSVTTEAAFDAFIAKMKDTTSAQEAAALSADLFGRAGARMGPLLMGAGDEVEALRERARELGIVMTQDSVGMAAAFADQADTLAEKFGVLKNQIGLLLIPVLTETLLPAIEDKVIPAIEWAVRSVEDMIKWFGDLPEPVREAAGAIALAFGVGGPVLLAVSATAAALAVLTAAGGPISLLIAAAATITAAWLTWGDEMKAAIGPAIDWITEKFRAFAEMLDGVVAKAGEIKAAVAGIFAQDFGSPAAQRPVEEGGLGQVQRPLDFSDDPSLGGGGFGAIGQGMAEGLIGGFQNGLAERMEDFDAAIRSLPEGARNALQIHSPSRVFAEIGTSIGEGLAAGIDASTGLALNSLDRFAGGAADRTAGSVDQILGSLGTMFEGSKGIAAAQALVNTWAGATEALKLPFPANLAAFAKVAATGLAAVRSIQSARPGSAGGAGGGAASGGGAAAQAAAPRETLEVRVQGLDPASLFTGAQVNGILDAVIKGARDRGLNLVFA